MKTQMRYLIGVIFLMNMVMCGVQSGQEKPFQKTIYNTTTLIVFYDKEIGDKYLMEEITNFNAKILYKYKNLGGVAISLPKNNDVIEAREHFQKTKGVLAVNLDEKNVLH